MTKTILITGVSGTGKSTLMKRLIEDFEVNEIQIYRHPETNKKYYYIKNSNHLYILGKYQQTYSGVDRFHPKSATVDLIEYIKDNDSDAIILCEGWCFKRYNYDEIIYLDADLDTVRQRLEYRSKTSNRGYNPDKFNEEYIKKLKSYRRTLQNKWNAKMLPYNTEEDTNSTYKYIKSLIL